MLKVISDLHLGVQRSAGTTPLTAWNLRQSMLKQAADLIDTCRDSDLMILGDLFDSTSVPMSDWLATFQMLQDRCSYSPRHTYLVGGNHDYPKTDTTLSSFQLLCAVLTDLNPGKVTAIHAPQMTPHGYVIPSLANQDLMDQALANVPTCEVVYLHVNYDNKFAAQSDQSLNLSPEQAELCPARNIIIAHEHQTRKVGKVWIPGNQIVSSVSDCLGSDAKRMTIVEKGQPRFEVLYPIHEVFEEISWSELRHSDKAFIRITGAALTNEAPDVVTAISNYRKSSNAFVVSNAVKILTEDGSDVFAKSLESVKAFDVMAALRAFLTPEEYSVVESLS